MITANGSRKWPMGLVAFALVFVTVGGIGGGWLVGTRRDLTLGHAYALLQPAAFTALCIIALRRDAKAARRLLPLLLGIVFLDIARGPHVPALSILAVLAGGLALAATFLSHFRLAMFATAICGAFLAATLFLGLMRR